MFQLSNQKVIGVPALSSGQLNSRVLRRGNFTLNADRDQTGRDQYKENIESSQKTFGSSLQNYYEDRVQNAEDEGTRQQAQKSVEAVKLGGKFLGSTYNTFSFAGVPEDVNSRMTMLAFAWGTVKQIYTHESIFQQVQTTHPWEWILFATFIVASIIPSLRSANRKDYEFGIFTEPAEVKIGRTAMLGFVGVLITEVLTQKPYLANFNLF